MLLDKSIIEKIDSQKMFSIYDKWPEIARESFKSDHNKVNFEKIEHIVFAGMGGSGAIGDIFASILSKTKIHVNVVKGYLLPQTVDSNTLVITISVSGNTVETLKVLESAQKLGCKIVAFSSGGKMQEYCKEKNIEYRFVKEYNSPRASFTSYLYSILNVLQNTLEIKQNDIEESLNKLEELKRKIDSSNLSEQNPSLVIARWIKHIPIICYPFGLQAAAIRFKNSLQENAKTHALTEDIIEFCHNGIVAWEKKSNIQPIFIQGMDDHAKTKERWKVVKEFFQENNIEYKEIVSVNGSILSKLINLIYLLDYSTIYKAILDEVDPSPVKSIDYIKNNLKV